MLPSQQKCQMDSETLHAHRQTISAAVSAGFSTTRKAGLENEAEACESHEMSKIVWLCPISSPVVAVVGFWLFSGPESLQSNCVYPLLYPEAWQHALFLTSIIWL